MRTQSCLVLVEGAVREALAFEGPDCCDRCCRGVHIFPFNQGPIVFCFVIPDFLDHHTDEDDGIVLLK